MTYSDDDNERAMKEIAKLARFCLTLVESGFKEHGTLEETTVKLRKIIDITKGGEIEGNEEEDDE